MTLYQILAHIGHETFRIPVFFFMDFYLYVCTICSIKTKTTTRINLGHRHS